MKLLTSYLLACGLLAGSCQPAPAVRTVVSSDLPLLLEAFIGSSPSESLAATQALLPDSMQICILFDSATAPRMQAYVRYLRHTRHTIRLRPDQTEYQIYTAYSDELERGDPVALRFHRAYPNAVRLFRVPVLLARVKFVLPNYDFGSAYDGFLQMPDGDWVYLPAFWEGLKPND